MKATPNWEHTAPSQTPYMSSNETNNIIYYCLFNLDSSFPSSLVFTITAFESARKAISERWKGQVCRIFQGLHLPDLPTGLLTLLVLLRLLHCQKNGKPFSNLYFAPYIMYNFYVCLFWMFSILLLVLLSGIISLWDFNNIPNIHLKMKRFSLAFVQFSFCNQNMIVTGTKHMLFTVDLN